MDKTTLRQGATSALLLGLTLQAGAAGLTLQSLNTPYPEFVASGDTVRVRVTADTSGGLAGTTVRLNGQDVTNAFTPDTAQSMTGQVSGLRPGNNVFELRSPASRAPLARLTVSTALPAQLDCSSLTTLAIPPQLLEAPDDVVQITSAVANAATSALPAHCQIRGRINPRIGVNNTAFAIGFELRLPAAWSGRFFFQGGGGNDGSVGAATGSPGNSGPLALTRGMASVLTDGGHTGGNASQFGFDPQARIDHAYNAFGKTAATAKAVMALYYGKRPEKSYFAGCSGGGRQGMMFTQRYPAYFDGVMAAAPAMRVATGASISAGWESTTYNAVAPVNTAGARILSQAFTNADLTLVANGVLNQCDALDGVVDGSINNPKACSFTPASLQCASATTRNACLTPAKVAALQRGFGGPVNSAGERLYFPWLFDAGIAAAGWRSWKLGTSTTATPNSAFSTLIQDAMANEFFTPPDPGFNIFNFNVDSDPPRMQAFGALYDTWRDVQLTGYRSHGGKLMLVNGQSDPIFSALETVDYLEQLQAANGSQATAEFARLFLVPGMNHCGGGPATDRFDTLTPLIDWVENGNAPQRLVASGASFPGRTRPLCPYPGYARYSGQGDSQDAANFVCTAPAASP